MSAFKYDAAAVAFGTEQINWLTDDIRALLVTGDYTPSKAHDVFVSAIPLTAIVVRSPKMTAMKITGGVFSGLIAEFDALSALLPVTALILYKNVGADDTVSPLIYFSDDGVGFPFLAQGLNYFVTFDQANGGWFS